MTTDDINDLMRWTAAAWIQDNVRPLVSSVSNKEDIDKASNPDYWELRHADAGSWGARKAQAWVNLPNGDFFNAQVVIDKDMGIGWVNEMKLERLNSAVRFFDIEENAPDKARAHYLEQRRQSLQAAVSWYTAKFNPALDTDIGTEGTDWELIEHYRPSIQSKCHCWIWLRMKDRGDTSYESSFLDPGKVIVEITPGLETTVSWISPPRNEWVMAPPPPAPGYGGWG